jgi:tetratricopeptide (TPR) repeat protein
MVNIVSVCLRATALAATVVLAGGIGLAQKGATEYHPVVVTEKRPPQVEGAVGGFSVSQDRFNEALQQAEVSLHASPPRYAEAEKAYHVAIAANRLDARAYFGLGYIYSAQQRYADALEPYQRAVEIEPRMPEAHFNLALTYLRLHNKEEAFKQLQILKKTKPDFASMLQQEINK